MPKYLDGAGLSRFWNNIKDSIGNASQAQVDAWLDNHPEATTTVQDGSITTTKLADDAVTDAKLTQAGGVLDDVKRLEAEVFVNANKEMYDAENTPTKHMQNSNGVFVTTKVYTGFILPVDASKGVLTVKKMSGAIFRIYASTDYPASNVSINHYKVENNGTVINFDFQDGDNYVYCIYYDSAHDTETEDVIKATISVYYGTETPFEVSYIDQLHDDVETLTQYFNEDVSTNLFDKSAAVEDYYINPNTGLTVANDDKFYAYVPITKAGHYMFYGNSTMFGTTQVKRIPTYDTTKTYIEYITGTHFDADSAGTWYGVEFDITQSKIENGAAYIAISQHVDNLERLMLVNADEYPSEYVPYHEPRMVINGPYIEGNKVLGGLENVLFSKTAVFLGDSICNGGSAGDGKRGWAGRIGDANEMSWYNYGVDGATVTSISGHHNISYDLESAHGEYPSADYVILEGGTNDADVLGAERLGTYDSSDYSGTYDTTTFSGSFEAMLYKAVNYWPYASIGYIAAHKMGNGSNRAMRRTYFERAMELCEKWGIPYIDLWTKTKLNRDFSSQYDSSMTVAENIAAGKLYTDGQHLTPLGYELITPVIEQWMRSI